MSHSEEYKKNLAAVSNMLEEYSNVWERFSNVTSDEELKVAYHTLHLLSFYLSKSYLVSLNTLKEINVLFNAIENLPRKSEYVEIKIMVEKQKENIVNTLIPIKEAFERSAEYENFGRKKTEE